MKTALKSVFGAKFDKVVAMYKRVAAKINRDHITRASALVMLCQGLPYFALCSGCAWASPGVERRSRSRHGRGRLANNVFIGVDVGSAGCGMVIE